MKYCKSVRLNLLFWGKWFLFVGALTLSEYTLHGENVSVHVKSSALCRYVDSNRNPKQLLQEGGNIKSGPITVWTAISGDEEALAKLQKLKLLPLRHLWLRSNKQQLVIDSSGVVETRDGEPIRVGDVRNQNGLKGEVDLTGAFDWRTWSNKRNFYTGSYVVIVLYQDGRAVTDSLGKMWTIDFTVGE